MSAKLALLFFLAALGLRSACAQPTEPRTVRISVLSLFQPQALDLRTAGPILLDGRPFRIPGNTAIHIQFTDSGQLKVDLSDRTLIGSILTLPASTFTLMVPHKLSRSYRGALRVSVHGHVLRSVIAMDPELAVASIVQAESPPHAGLEALKAQAVAARSFLLANLRAHTPADLEPDACDTTHCQFLRGPPPPGSPAGIAARATAGLVLTWQPDAGLPPRLVPAMYSRSCGGHTHARQAAAPGDYPFYPVDCAFCLRHPELWSRSSSAAPTSEQERLAWNRTHGWSAIPSLTLTPTTAGLEGRGTGHGIGLCQLGAADLAAHGETFPRILAHFYPNTQLTRLSQV